MCVCVRVRSVGRRVESESQVEDDESFCLTFEERLVVCGRVCVCARLRVCASACV